MINVLDAVLRDFLLMHVAQLVDESQIGFEPPDDVWRSGVASLSVGGSPANALNVYLVDVVENRKLRANERTSIVDEGVVTLMPAPARVDCHYLISAWSPATATPAASPAMDEHALLYEVLAALEQNLPINPSRVYPPGSAAVAAIDELIRMSDLPSFVGSESFAKLPEFWGTMGVNNRWKPVLHLVVTLPVRLLHQVAGPMVTTRITQYRTTGAAASAETWVQIGGRVMDATVSPPRPLADAWVQIQASGGGLPLETVTGNLGRFSFAHLRPGAYVLRCRARGFTEPPPRNIDVPSPSGEYDLELV